MGPLLLVLVGALAACSSGSRSTTAPPRWPGLDRSIEVTTTDQCRRVLVVGDSIAHGMAPFLARALQRSGRCATVVDHSIPGSSLGDTQGQMAAYLADARPDLVVVHHIGNQGASGPFWSDPDYLAAAGAAAVGIVDQARAAGADVYWAIPPVGAWNCRFDTENAQRWQQWATWVRDRLPHERPVRLVDWRSPFGGPTYTAKFTFPAGVRTVRLPDCVHLSPVGSRIAADATVSALQDQWTRDDTAALGGSAAARLMASPLRRWGGAPGRS